MRKFFIVLLTILAVMPGAVAQAGTLKGVTMNDAIEVDGHKLVLNGMALRKKLIFKVYVAGLYLAAKESDAARILAADQPRRGVMHFLRDVGADKINNAWFEGLAANTPGASPDLKNQFKFLAGMMEEMKDGESMMFTYIPGTGTQIAVKGNSKGVIPGKAFADALFGCWIGPEPGPGQDFKDALLGNE